MEELKKGCVYFFRHIGLTPVKIGFSTNESPIDRFNQFKTYAPYGSEILGFIQTDESKSIETKLHLKYSSKRLLGEWFEITENEVNEEVNFYSNIEDIKNRNEFQIAWANSLINKKTAKENLVIESRVDVKKTFVKMYLNDNKINKVHTAKKLGISRQTIHLWIKELKK